MLRIAIVGAAGEPDHAAADVPGFIHGVVKDVIRGHNANCRDKEKQREGGFRKEGVRD
jgi:hypothetical protein